MAPLIEIQPHTLHRTPPSIRKYQKLTPRIYTRIIQHARHLRGLTVLHINSTATSGAGGVAEILRSQVPLERSLGIDSKWFIIQPDPSFFRITKKIHNLLQGKENSFLLEKEKVAYVEESHAAHRKFRQIIAEVKPDIIIIHDPQPLPLVECIPPDIVSILRMHIDLSDPEPDTLKFFRPFIEQYQYVILTSPKYRPQWLSEKKIFYSTPTIDPFAVKNKPLSLARAKKILQFFNIHTERPLITQVSRFDPWKDPLGVIQAYYIAKNKIPNLQLVLAGIMFAQDDPEAREILKHVKKHASDPDIFLFAYPEDLKGISNNLFINALQTASDIVIQKSLREGFGLTVTEAMWKGKAVIGGKTEGISLQIKNGKNGIIVSSPEETAKAIIRLCKNPGARKRLGTAAKKTVQNKFLLSRLILDHLKMYAKVRSGKK